jgi:hypothetical protein
MTYIKRSNNRKIIPIIPPVDGLAGLGPISGLI